MITTKAEIVTTALTSAYDPTTLLIFTGCIICTALGAAAMYWPAYHRGYKVADAKGDKFWSMQQEIKARNARERWKKASKNAKKGWDTRRATRKLIEPLTGTECDL